MWNLLKTVFLIFLFSFSGLAQTKIDTCADVWNGLKIDMTTPEEAFVIMGKPSEDSIGKLDYKLFPQNALGSLLTGTDLRLPDSWIASRKDEKVFLKLVYSRNGAYKKIELTFLENKLYLIDLTLTRKKDERLPAADLGKMYKTDFVSVESIPKNAEVADYEKQKEPTIPKAYSKFYGMLSITPTSVLLAFVNNDSFKAEFWSGKGEARKEQFPGVVTRLQIISRIISRNIEKKNNST